MGLRPLRKVDPNKDPFKYENKVTNMNNLLETIKEETDLFVSSKIDRKGLYLWQQ